MLSRKLIKKQPRRKLITYSAALGLLALTFGVAGVALAVHDLEFQLDGDVLASTTTHVGSKTQTVDWDSLFDASGNKKTLPTNFQASVFKKDFNNTGTTFATNDSTTYATGSKDTLDITPGWQCNRDANVNSKIDIMNAYAAAYKDPASGHDILYFSLERNSNAGDGNVGFWFLQDAVACSSPGGSVAFTGHHLDGDLLIVSAFTNGGAVSTIDVYRWNDADGPGGAVGALGQTPVAHGVDCRGTVGGDSACATVNNATIPTPWITSNKKDGVVNHTLYISEFFEGGLDLTANNLSGKCFNTFMADTRSSQSLTATLFDFALGTLGECTSSTVTTPSDGSGAADNDFDLPTGGAGAATVSVKDKAVVTVTGSNTWSGTVSFFLCGPIASGTCDTGGVAAGVKNINQSTSGGVVFSDATSVTEAGRYCWRADFSGDSSKGVPASSDHSTTECFTVNPVQPTLSTTASSGPVDLGTAVNDSITISGTTSEPGSGGGGDGSINPTTAGSAAQGTITLTAYGPDDCITVAFGPVTLNVNGDGTYGGAGSTAEFTPTAPGVYTFVASYDGDLPNTKAIAATACGDQPAAEQVTVRQVPTEIKTKQSWYPNDTATITSTIGNLGAGGTVDFALYDNASCTGTALYTESATLTGGNPTEEVGTSNGPGATGAYLVSTGYGDPADSVVGPLYWKVTYTPTAGDTGHLGSVSDCVENHTYTYTNDPGPSN